MAQTAQAVSRLGSQVSVRHRATATSGTGRGGAVLNASRTLTGEFGVGVPVQLAHEFAYVLVPEVQRDVAGVEFEQALGSAEVRTGVRTERTRPGECPTPQGSVTARLTCSVVGRMIASLEPRWLCAWRRCDSSCPVPSRSPAS
jgi:hypothetical protein